MEFTAKSWESAEAGLNGVVPNRVYQYDGKPSVVNVAILSWEDLDGKRPTPQLLPTCTS
ncbi:MAG: hypothetical protein R2784_09085 [Saprospiraceae bacterium]